MKHHNKSKRRHYKGGDFNQTTPSTTQSTTSTSTSTMEVVEQKATGFLDTIKEYASNIKNKASEYINKATTGGKRRTTKLRKPTKGTNVPLKPLLYTYTNTNYFLYYFFI